MNEYFNKILLIGSVSAPPEYDHTVLGEAFYRMKVSAARLSGNTDVLPVTVSERLLDGSIFEEAENGVRMEIEGQLRTYNQRTETGSHLIIQIFARDIRIADDEYEDRNEAELWGRVCKPVVYRKTPFQREISDILIAVGRRYGKSDYLPCIAWGRNARFAAELQPGDAVRIFGRMQSREYQKKDEQGITQVKTAYEISCSAIEKQSL